jgi:hypothetical protein
MAENLVKSNPKTYFNFPSCITCFQKPCERLRYGGVYPGKFIIVHSREYSFTNCHFSAASIDEVGQLLSNLQVHDFTYEIGKIISLMSPAEQIHWNMDHLVTGYSDWAGYLEFIQRLSEERIIIILRIPYFYQQDLKVRRWLHALEGGVELIHKVEKDDLSGKAATDALIDDGSSSNSNKPDDTDKEDEKIGNIVLKLAIDPDAPESQDDKFLLESEDKSYSSQKTVKDDQIPGDGVLELEFKDIKDDINYTFTIDHGQEGDIVTVFENVSGKELKKNA